jgi:hypothetical protein
MSSNWFNAAASVDGRNTNNLTSSSSFQGQQQQFQPQQQQSQSMLFNGTSSTNNLYQSSFGSSGNGFDNLRENIPQSDLAESQSLQSRYLESFTPQGKKKGGAVSTVGVAWYMKDYGG